MEQSGIIYIYSPIISRPGIIQDQRKIDSGQARMTKRSGWRKTIGAGMIFISITGILLALLPAIRLESNYLLTQSKAVAYAKTDPVKTLPNSVPIVFNPLIAPDGTEITPVNTDFSLIIPKIGVNAPILADVNPADPKQYKEALLNGVAHASTSVFPDQTGAVYLFSHSTNYAWFVKDLNAVFYLVKDLDTDDTIVIYYKGHQYVYKITEKRIVKPNEISYLLPQSDKKQLILQTCWPPGSTTERLLVFADLLEIH